MNNTFNLFNSSELLINILSVNTVEICRGVASSLDKRLGGVDSDL